MSNEKGDLISRNALGIGLCNPDAFPENRGYADGWNSAIALINAAPAVDAVEVVRCEKCYWNCAGECTHEYWADAEGWSKSVDSNGFCHLGERRDGE